MSTRVWLGHAPAVAQVTTITYTDTWATDDTATLTINGKSITVTLGATQTIPALLDLLIEAWNDSTIPEFAEITATEDGTDTLTLTADTAGVPFTVSASVDTAGDGDVGSPTNSVEATGPNHWDNAANWSGGAVPVNSDDVVLANSEVSVKYGLAQSAVTLDSLVIEQSFTGDVGLPRTNTDGSSYVEYRAQYLAIGATAFTIGKGEGSGSGRLKIDNGSVQTALNVYNSGSPAETGLPAILWKGTNASNAVTVNKGSFGAAVFPGEAATVATLRVGYTTNVTGDAVVWCGDGVTLTTVNQSGGTLTAASTITTHNQTAGELIFSDKQDGTTAAITTLNLDAGAARYRATGTLVTANVGSDGVLDFRQDQRSRTVTNCNIYERSELHDPFKTVTFTNGVDLVRCGPLDVMLDIGQHLTLTPSAI